jgi:hypothetical protein
VVSGWQVCRLQVRGGQRAPFGQILRDINSTIELNALNGRSCCFSCRRLYFFLSYVLPLLEYCFTAFILVSVPWLTRFGAADSEHGCEGIPCLKVAPQSPHVQARKSSTRAIAFNFLYRHTCVMYGLFSSEHVEWKVASRRTLTLLWSESMVSQFLEAVLILDLKASEMRFRGQRTAFSRFIAGLWAEKRRFAEPDEPQATHGAKRSKRSLAQPKDAN